MAATAQVMGKEPAPEPLLQPSDSAKGTFLKYSSLFLLCAQNTIFILSMRYVRTRPGDLFFTTTAVVLQESIKCLVSLIILLVQVDTFFDIPSWREASSFRTVQEGSVKLWLKHLHDNIIKNPTDCLKISVPSLVYTMQNNLIFVGVSNLDAATFQVTYQLKLLTTAVLSVIMIKKVLSRVQWIALLLLFAGVSIVQLQPENVTVSQSSTPQNPLVGLIAVIVACIMSGFAGVYYERILKGTPQSLWLRNVQLGGIGAVVGVITMELSDGSLVREKGFFHGYDGWVWFVIVLQSCGGLIVAVVVKYADNILKGFATSAAIIVSCVGSVFFFGTKLSIQFCLGASCVILAIYLYSKFLPPKPSSVISSAQNNRSSDYQKV